MRGVRLSEDALQSACVVSVVVSFGSAPDPVHVCTGMYVIGLASSSVEVGRELRTVRDAVGRSVSDLESV
jgi:hypothetical protein